MRNNRLLPYETIIQAVSGEPEAVGTVLQYYSRRIQCAARVNGRVDQDTEDYITQTLLAAIFKFRFGR
ncbi:helix-turn-helix domain-containing protein [Anaerotruncus sp. X29]|jgi:Txe/YoeB family toxin of Txe-Axe toxin-antitoxin module|uniref:helix-turn-helix domain-containing protein n=1 Tax=Faecalicatena contorta TaxID=39482 RepID=UPI00137977F1|nr:helix-turn-helix domain-containing protein [Faecalicatena contorta]NCE76435.1 helix-turn-helix domain-containing protein [Anaerotruncus sp. X29]